MKAQFDEKIKESCDEFKQQLKFQRHNTLLHKQRADGYK